VDTNRPQNDTNISHVIIHYNVIYFRHYLRIHRMVFSMEGLLKPIPVREGVIDD